MAKTGKWASFKGKLQPFKIEPKWQEQVDESKEAFIGCTVAELSRAFVIARNEKKNLEAQVKEQNTEIEAISQLLIEQLEGNETQKVGLDSGRTVYLQSEPYSTVADREKVMAWIKKNKMQFLLSIQWKKYNTFVKECLINSQAIPPGTEVFYKTSARVTGDKGEE